MSFKKSTTMSVKRILISLLLFILILPFHWILTRLTGNSTLSMMFVLNFTAWILIIYDWELFGLHWNRAKANMSDTILYFVVGFIALFFWTLINSQYLGGSLVLPDPAVFKTDPIAGPAVRFAYSLSLGTILNIEFKCFTDHMKFYAREATMILLTAFLFGLLHMIVFPVKLSLIIPTYLYNILLFALLSYLYNQTHSILPGILSFTAVYLCWMILFAA